MALKERVELGPGASPGLETKTTTGLHPGLALGAVVIAYDGIKTLFAFLLLTTNVF